MAALRDLWQEQRQQRQQQLAQRQRQVRQALAVVRQERQNRATQLRSNLSAFRADLSDENDLRQINQQLLRLELQESVQSLRQETQNFLAYSKLERQVQTEELAKCLHEFVQGLQQQTAQFLALTAAERSLMAQQLTQDLRNFHSELSQTVSGLRQNLHADLTDLKQATQTHLSTSRQQRALMRMQQLQQFVTDMEQLRATVQAELWELSLTRQERAQQLQQMLSQSRTQREAQVASLFHRFSGFRAELQQYRADLRQSVWGVGSHTQLVESPAIAAPQTPPAAATKSTPSSASAPIAQVTKPEEPSGVDREKEIYNYLHQSQGARLSELETALALNRIQAVDGLRSLITKGLITQRDRVYYTQEEFSL